MCGRYSLYTTDKLGDRFHLEDADIAEITDDLKERYNIGPSQIVPAIIEDESKRRIELMRWGFLPRWAKDTKTVFKYKTFNARAEDIFNKPTWKNAIRHTRCLIPANGFYEWRASPSGKQPFFIHPKDQQLFSFAGVYGAWTDEEGNEWDTCSIVTTNPNKDMESIHDRMPVILEPADEERWLNPDNETPETIAGLMQPYPDGMLEIYPVSREVNTTRIDKDTLVLPVNSK